SASQRRGPDNPATAWHERPPRNLASPDPRTGAAGPGLHPSDRPDADSLCARRRRLFTPTIRTLLPGFVLSVHPVADGLSLGHHHLLLPPDRLSARLHHGAQFAAHAAVDGGHGDPAA